LLEHSEFNSAIALGLSTFASPGQTSRTNDLPKAILTSAMNGSETQRYLELLKRRVASLRLMAKELRECRESFTSMDLEATRDHISYQQGLCAEIRSLDDELRLLLRQLAAVQSVKLEGLTADKLVKLFDAGSASQLHEVLADLAVVQENVKRLNRVYAGLLRRSRRSINVLINVMANYIGTYNPAPGRSQWSLPW
jgi:hypothetical protein